jgi:hypothetical protein
MRISEEEHIVSLARYNISEEKNTQYLLQGIRISEEEHTISLARYWIKFGIGPYWMEFYIGSYWTEFCY